ncbi:MAG TPA: nicotinate phosphoribosyltransferase [Chitinispirillaceae bacterium]|nr:nicotinate phosphoribosyltransferase [Chitinispirillaceae bacterium]
MGKSIDISEGILFTDYYQFTMAQLYFHEGIHTRRVQFDYFFRNYPDYGGHQAGYCINAGLEWFISWMKNVSFTDSSIKSLADQHSSSGEPVFKPDFLDYLKGLSVFDKIDLRAISEGRVIHAHEPLLIIQGELLVVQILETALLNNLNYQILIATKASRIKEAGEGRPLIEFGLRRAHNTGANAGTRAALIGGADFSSNTGMSCKLGFAPKGTHAHSMVQVFMALGEGELGAFMAYAKAYPDDCLLLVDTINTLESGIPNAIKVFEMLRRKGHHPVGIRLDSGDLAYLAIQGSAMLDNAGFDDTVIVLSNNIDEMVLLQIVRQISDEAPHYGVDPQKVISRLIYGVGTNLITSQGRSALDGVYKLTAVKNDDTWVPALKISDSAQKATIPGNKQLWRIYDTRKLATADLISLHYENPVEWHQVFLQHPFESDLNRIVGKTDISSIEPLFTDIIKDGKLCYTFPSVDQLRQIRERDLAALEPGVKRLINPHSYHVSLSDNLWKLKEDLIKKQKNCIEPPGQIPKKEIS